MHYPVPNYFLWQRVEETVCRRNTSSEGKHRQHHLPPAQPQPRRQDPSNYFLNYSNLNENIKEIFRIFILLGKVLTVSLLECQGSILLHMMDSSL